MSTIASTDMYMYVSTASHESNVCECPLDIYIHVSKRQPWSTPMWMTVFQVSCTRACPRKENQSLASQMSTIASMDMYMHVSFVSTITSAINIGHPVFMHTCPRKKILSHYLAPCKQHKRTSTDSIQYFCVHVRNTCVYTWLRLWRTSNNIAKSTRVP